MKAAGGWVLSLAIACLGYVLHCLIWPQRDCRWCDGKGVHRPVHDRSVSRRCWWCKGAGKRDRFWTRWRARRRTHNASR